MKNLIPNGSYDVIVHGVSSHIAISGKASYIKIVFKIASDMQVFDCIVTWVQNERIADFGLQKLKDFCDSIGLIIGDVIRDKDIAVFIGKKLTIEVVGTDIGKYDGTTYTMNKVTNYSKAFKYRSQTS